MHRSRLVGILTDAPAPAADFWSAALGATPRPAPGGHLLCVVPVHSDPEAFARSARTWP